MQAYEKATREHLGTLKAGDPVVICSLHPRELGAAEGEFEGILPHFQEAIFPDIFNPGIQIIDTRGKRVVAPLHKLWIRTD